MNNFPLEPFRYSQADWVKAKALVALHHWPQISNLIDEAFGAADGLSDADTETFLRMEEMRPPSTVLIAASFRILRWRAAQPCVLTEPTMDDSARNVATS